jgi:hypothetical protein
VGIRPVFELAFNKLLIIYFPFIVLYQRASFNVKEKNNPE